MTALTAQQSPQALVGEKGWGDQGGGTRVSAVVVVVGFGGARTLEDDGSTPATTGVASRGTDARGRWHAWRHNDKQLHTLLPT